MELIDLALSSLGSFVSIFAFNIATILQISKQNDTINQNFKLILTIKQQPQLRLHISNNNQLISFFCERFEGRKVSDDNFAVATFLFLVMRTPIAMEQSFKTLFQRINFSSISIQSLLCQCLQWPRCWPPYSSMSNSRAAHISVSSFADSYTFTHKHFI